MNRQQILALLRRHGIQVADTATNSELRALLIRLPASESQACTQAIAFLDAQPPDQPAAPQPPGHQAAMPPAPPAAQVPAAPQAVVPAQQPGDQAADIRTLNQVVANLQAERDRERRARLTRELDVLVNEDRLEGNERDFWLEECVRNEAVLDRLRSRPPINRPGHQPLNVMITADDPNTVVQAMTRFRQPVASMLRGERIDPMAIRNAAMAMGNAIATHRERLQPILNANTIDADLKRNVILSDIMRAYKRRLILLNVFSTSFRNVPLEGTNKVVVPFYELDTVASKNFVQADGYVFDHDTSTGKRDVTVDKRKYKPFDFSSEDFRRQPYFRPEQNMMLKAEQLAVDVWLDVLSLVTIANFGAAVAAIAAASFDVDDVIAIGGECDKADWGDVGRALVIGTDYRTALLQDTSLKFFMNSGSTEALREGSIGRLDRFDVFPSPRIPHNSQNLTGFAALPPAILIATSPIMPAPGVRRQLVNYDVVVDPQTGIAFEYRYWGDPDKDEDREVVECNYGYGKGNAAALKRITSIGS